jgi:hypothetical protein
VPTVSLDEFVETLRNSMAEAQASLERSNQGRLERLIELARDGRSEALTWSFVIDGSSDSGPARRTVRLPPVTMFPPLAVRVTEAKLDLNVAVERTPVRRKNNAGSQLRLQICRRAASLRRRLHQLTVHLTATQDVAAEILVDGVHFKTVSAEPNPQKTSSSQVIQRSGEKTK